MQLIKSSIALRPARARVPCPVSRPAPLYPNKNHLFIYCRLRINELTRVIIEIFIPFFFPSSFFSAAAACPPFFLKIIIGNIKYEIWYNVIIVKAMLYKINRDRRL